MVSSSTNHVCMTADKVVHLSHRGLFSFSGYAWPCGLALAAATLSRNALVANRLSALSTRPRTQSAVSEQRLAQYGIGVGRELGHLL